MDGAVYLKAAFTGLRMGELLALGWRDVAGFFPWPRLRVAGRPRVDKNAQPVGEQPTADGKADPRPAADTGHDRNADR
jgi:integrase